MNYTKNETGDIKVMDAKGNIKWLNKMLVEDHRLMKSMGFTAVPKPVYEAAEPAKPEIEATENEVAESAPAKRGRKSTKE